MNDIEVAMDVKENRAKIEMLERKFSALVEILKKEGVTSPEEVDSLVSEKTENE